MLDALLLELEGVLVDTHEVRRSTLVQSFSEAGLAVTFAEYDERATGLSTAGAAVRLAATRVAHLDATAIDLIVLRAERAFTERMVGGAMLCPGAGDLVTSVAGRTRLALVTRARRTEAHCLLGMAGLESAFETIVSADDVLDPKPHPEAYRMALQRLSRRRSVDHRRCVAIEDAPPGIRAARAAGLRCLVVGPTPPHQAFEADGYITTLSGQTLPSLSALVTADRKERVG